MSYKVPSLLFSAVLILTACGSDSDGSSEDPGSDESAETIHWSYEGEGGPEMWATLEAENAACGTGTSQSPVDIPADAPVNADGVV